MQASEHAPHSDGAGQAEPDADLVHEATEADVAEGVEQGKRCDNVAEIGLCPVQIPHQGWLQ